MKIGIIGSGDVGRKLGDGFIELGHWVKIGSRDSNQSKITEWINKHGKENASSGTFSDTAGFGEIIILATLWTGTLEALQLANPRNLANKIVIDVTNPLDFSKGMPPTLAVGHTDSAGETIQRMLPDSKVVKSFNIIGNPHMIHPDFPGGKPTMFICGNDEDAKKIVTNDILSKFGWETIDIGDIEGSRLLHYFRTGSGNHAFKLLQK